MPTLLLQQWGGDPSLAGRGRFRGTLVFLVVAVCVLAVARLKSSSISAAASLFLSNPLGGNNSTEIKMAKWRNKETDSDCPVDDGGSSSDARINILPSRASSLYLNQSFSFVHISKCAGAAWIKLLKSIVMPNGGTMFPQSPQGVELSVPYQNIRHPADYMLISVRSPRMHVWSQYGECRWGYWSKVRTTLFPDQDNVTADEGFDFWLSHFVQPTLSGSKYTIKKTMYDHIGCYHPSNFQSRFLVTKSPKAHQMDRRVGFEPDPNAAIRNLRTMLNFVAVQDFFHESKCLLFYRLSGVTFANNTGDTIFRYLDDTCRCPPPPLDARDEKVTHHDLGLRRSNLLDMDEDGTLAMVDALTRSDVPVFKAALNDWLQEIVRMETKLGRRVLCDATLQGKEPEFAYLNLNLTELYYQKRRLSECSPSSL